MHVDGEGVGAEIALDVGELAAAFGAVLDVLGDGDGLFAGEELHGVECEVFGVGMARADRVDGLVQALLPWPGSVRIGFLVVAHG